MSEVPLRGNKSFDIAQLSEARDKRKRRSNQVAILLLVVLVAWFGFLSFLAYQWSNPRPYGRDDATVIMLLTTAFFTWLAFSQIGEMRPGPIELSLSDESITLTYRNGGSRRYNWKDRSFHLDLYDFRNCPVGWMGDPAWIVTWTGAIITPISAECLEAIRDYAKAYGLTVGKGKESFLKRLSEKMVIPICTDVYRLRR